jgi:hypothetical protein
LKEIKKTEIEKKQKRIKIESDLGGNLSAQLQIEPAAQEAPSPNRCSLPLSPSLPGGPHLSASSSPLISLLFLSVTGNAGDLLPAVIPSNGHQSLLL